MATPQVNLLASPQDDYQTTVGESRTATTRHLSKVSISLAAAGVVLLAFSMIEFTTGEHSLSSFLATVAPSKVAHVAKGTLDRAKKQQARTMWGQPFHTSPASFHPMATNHPQAHVLPGLARHRGDNTLSMDMNGKGPINMNRPTSEVLPKTFDFLAAVHFFVGLSIVGTLGYMYQQRMAMMTLETTNSDKIFNEAKTLMPGGVSSPVRAFKSVGGQPIVFDSVKGSHITDVDGNDYIDYVGTWGPAICGHANEEVIEALNEQMQKGTSFGAPSALENVLAQMVIDAVPCVDMVRFTNSGTEACMGALRLMRAYTGRDKILKFVGCYHGHADPFLVQAGSGIATLNLPDSPGVPEGATVGTLCVPYNDLDAVKAAFEANKGQIAGVILEPVVGNAGFIVPTKEFLQGLRDLCTADGAVLCFDEVMTGFRIAYGCAQSHWGITPDLTTMGKVIGGGLPVGAFGGKKEIMEHVAPAGPMYQAGTLSGNPLAMTAGIKTLEILKRPGQYEQLDKVTKRLVEGILAAAKANNVPMCGGSISGMFGFFFQEGPVTNFEEATKSNTKAFADWHRGMLEEGIYLAPSQYEAGFTSLAHTEDDIDKTIAAAQKVLASEKLHAHFK